MRHSFAPRLDAASRWPLPECLSADPECASRPGAPVSGSFRSTRPPLRRRRTRLRASARPACNRDSSAPTLHSNVSRPCVPDPSDGTGSSVDREILLPLPPAFVRAYGHPACADHLRKSVATLALVFCLSLAAPFGYSFDPSSAETRPISRLPNLKIAV